MTNITLALIGICLFAFMALCVVIQALIFEIKLRKYDKYRYQTFYPYAESDPEDVI